MVAKRALPNGSLGCSPLCPQSHYVDVFGGGGAMVLAKPRHTVETFNDLNSDIANYFRVLQTDRLREQLFTRLRYTLFSRAVWARCRAALDNRRSSAVSRAYAWLYVQYCSYGGIDGGGFRCVENRSVKGIKRLLPVGRACAMAFPGCGG